MEHLRSLSLTARSMANAAFSRDRSPDRTLKLMGKLHYVAEANLNIVYKRLQALPQAQRDVMTPQCSAGCDFCCAQIVRVTACEVIAVYGFVLGNFSNEQQAELHQRLAETRDYMLSLPQGARFRHWCPLLIDHKCSVYLSRPFICRGVNSTSVEACKIGLEDPVSREIIPMVDSLRDVTVSVRYGLRESMIENHLSGTDLNLHLALFILMSDPSAIHRFFAGEPVFESANMRDDE
jgi:Fe-S-cluster containining protein